MQKLRRTAVKKTREKGEKDIEKLKEKKERGGKGEIFVKMWTGKKEKEIVAKERD